MTSQHEKLREFLMEGAEIMTQACSVITSSTDEPVLVQAYQNRRGWEIHCFIANDNPHLEEELLTVTKSTLEETFRSSKRMCLLDYCTNPWKFAKHGFRALLVCKEDQKGACRFTYKTGQCPNGDQCSLVHPVRVKRLYLVVRTQDATVQLNTSASKKLIAQFCNPLYGVHLATNSDRPSETLACPLHDHVWSSILMSL